MKNELNRHTLVDHFIIIVLVHAITVQDVSSERNLYCKMDCRLSTDMNTPVKHTMCAYKKGGPESCNKTSFFLTRNDKRWVLEQLNNVRAKIARGLESRGDGGEQPSAGNMMKLVWHGELAMFGRRWANQCDGGLHDVCRTPLDGQDVGQNSYVDYFGEDRLSDRYGRMGDAISTWLAEVVHMKPAWVENYPAEAEAAVGNYSQLVWGVTVHVGCAYSEFGVGDRYKFRFICNFKQEGNKVGQRVYRPDTPCESCPPNVVCSATWAGLCFNGEANYFIDQEVSRGLLPAIAAKCLLLGSLLLLYV